MAEKKSEFLARFPDTLCNISETCRQLNIGRRTVTQWRHADPEFDQAIEEAREGLKDMAESALLEKIKKGDTIAILFFLKTQARDRGYIERPELAGLADINIHIERLIVDRREGIEADGVRVIDHGED